MTYQEGQYIPIFPLPSTVLFPRILLPLHIFEPRYRLMISEVLDSYGRIAVALMKSPSQARSDVPPDAHPVMGLGRVMTYETRPDGTSNIFLLGEERVRVSSLQEGKHFRRARLDVMADVPPPSTHRRDKLRATLKRWLEQLTKDWKKNEELQRLQRVFASQTDVGFLVDFLAHHFLEDPQEKQTLLELLEVELRAERLHRALKTRWPS